MESTHYRTLLHIGCFSRPPPHVTYICARQRPLSARWLALRRLRVMRLSFVHRWRWLAHRYVVSECVICRCRRRRTGASERTPVARPSVRSAKRLPKCYRQQKPARRLCVHYTHKGVHIVQWEYHRTYSNRGASRVFSRASDDRVNLCAKPATIPASRAVKHLLVWWACEGGIEGTGFPPPLPGRGCITVPGLRTTATEYENGG